ncbi:hypothetical protein V1512DRAFT_34756 [Lipomyces arxii]|uniref:uncharacterized protein n=1 Tax=Lipomyces arxii TaxID=56418 RepID=UPI0034CF5BBD
MTFCKFVNILILGFSNFLWLPLATRFGRRPTSILSALIELSSSIWCAKAHPYYSFRDACALQRIAVGPGEILPKMMIANVLFLHERGFRMGVHTCGVIWVHSWSVLLLLA